MDRKTYTVKDAMRLTGLGKNAIYAAVASGEIEGVRIGKRVLILKEPLDKMLAGSGLKKPSSRR